MNKINLPTSGYYVYAHLLNGKIFYIGKGNGGRAFDLRNRSKKWKEYVGENEFVEVQVISSHKESSEAILKEAGLIAEFDPPCNTVHTVRHVVKRLKNDAPIKFTKIEIFEKMKSIDWKKAAYRPGVGMWVTERFMDSYGTYISKSANRKLSEYLEGK